MPLPKRCEILVVGAGPAGSSAAAAAAQGAETVLIDRKVRIGEQPHCGEFVPRQVFTELGLDRLSVVQSVEFMESRIIKVKLTKSAASAAGRTHRSPGFMIDRARFDRDLAREAASKGALVQAASRLIAHDSGDWTILHGGKEQTFRPDLVIAADGAMSTVASFMGMKLPNVLRGLQVETPLLSPLNRTFVFLNRAIVGGYGWLFPKRNVANVGVGAVPGNKTSPGKLLDELVQMLRETEMIGPGILARSGGLIPVSGMRPSLVTGNVLFCGDAAGLTHPITGAGIPQALISGRAAGHAAVSSLRHGNRQALLDYENETRGQYEGVIGHALSKREVMMKHWDNKDFEKTCKNTWIAFTGYRKRER
jgi:digeranylgeranylglycerophospholipid reductase